MEVHHHPHVEKKSFKEYLLEGLMIFLAVSMGFIAENIRENITENHKAQELAESLYQEVKADSITMQEKISLRVKKASQIDHLGTKFGKAMMWTNQFVSTILFEPQDGILTQLRNSSSFKFYKSTALQNAIGSYTVSINRVRIRNEQEYNIVDNFLRKESIKHFDFKWQEKVTRDGEISILQLINSDQIAEYPFEFQNKNILNRSESAGIVAQYLLVLRGTTQLQYQGYINANHALLVALRKNYRLEKE